MLVYITMLYQIVRKCYVYERITTDGLKWRENRYTTHRTICSRRVQDCTAGILLHHLAPRSRTGSAIAPSRHSACNKCKRSGQSQYCTVTIT